jgi:hypothetical protein
VETFGRTIEQLGGRVQSLPNNQSAVRAHSGSIDGVRQKTATPIYIAQEHRIYVPLHLLNEPASVVCRDA